MLRDMNSDYMFSYVVIFSFANQSNVIFIELQNFFFFFKEYLDESERIDEFRTQNFFLSLFVLIFHFSSTNFQVNFWRNIKIVL